MEVQVESHYYELKADNRLIYFDEGSSTDPEIVVIVVVVLLSLLSLLLLSLL